LPRPTYQEAADKADEDFARAAELLPIDWDKTTVGRNTAGRISFASIKIMALGYLGKKLPLGRKSADEKTEPRQRGTKTYDYDTDYMKKSRRSFLVSYFRWLRAVRHSMRWQSITTKNIQTT